MNGNEVVGQEKIIPPPGFILDATPGQNITPPPGFVLDKPTPPAGFALDSPKSDLRLDGTPKGLGFFGPLKRPDGNISTELSAGFNDPEFGGKETQVPLLVPTLTRDEIDSLLSGATVSPEIYRKAKEYALSRISSGKTPFAQAGEQIPLPPGGEVGGQIGQVVVPAPTPKPTWSQIPGPNSPYEEKAAFIENYRKGHPDTMVDWEKILSGQANPPTPGQALQRLPEAIVGIAEGVGTAVVGMGQFVGKTVAQLGANIWNIIKGDPQASTKAQAFAENVTKWMNYTPQTESGKTVAGAITYPFQKASEALEYALDKAGFDPEQKAGARLLVDTFLLTGMFGEFNKGVKDYFKKSAGTGLPVNMAKVKEALAADPGISADVKMAVDKIQTSEIPPAEVSQMMKGFEESGVPAQFQPPAATEMAFPKTPAEILKIKKAETATAVQAQWDELHPPTPLTEEPIAQINIHKDGRIEVVPGKKAAVVPEIAPGGPRTGVSAQPMPEVGVKELPGAMAIRARKAIEAAKTTEAPAIMPAETTLRSITDANIQKRLSDLEQKVTSQGEVGKIPIMKGIPSPPTEIKAVPMKALAPTETVPPLKVPGPDLMPGINRMLALGKELTAEQKQFLRDKGILQEAPPSPETAAPGTAYFPETDVSKLKEFYGGYDFVGEIKKAIQAIQEKRAAKRAGIPETVPAEATSKETVPPLSEADQFQHDFIKEAISKGKTIPADVLAKYPDLVSKAPEADVPTDPVQAVLAALKEAKPARKQQEALYSKERSARLGAALKVGEETPGEAGFYKQLAPLKGALPKVDFESIRGKISQGNIDSLFQMVEDSAAVKGYDKINTKEGLAKLFGEFGGGVPQPHELALLEKVFGPELVKELIDKRSTFKKMKDLGLEIANIPRAFMASTDVSFGLRQGVVMATRHPLIFWKDFPTSLKFFASEKAFRASQEEIASRPNYDLMKESKLPLTDVGPNVRAREEPFQSQLAEKIPIAGTVVRASDRAFTGFANRLRADVFDYLVKRAEDQGLDPHKDIKLSKDIAKVIGVMTGRGPIGKLEGAAPALNAFFFSPRLMAARLNMLNPAYYIKLEPFARKEALTGALSFVGTGLTVTGLAKLAGVEVGTDPRSADFGKMKFGNTRVDIWGGFQQYARLAAQLITGEMVSSTTGKVVTLGEGYKPMTRLDILGRAAESKEAPVFSFVTGLLRGTSGIGQDFKLGPEIGNRFVPMVIQDLIDIAKDDPSLIPVSALGVMGIGLQTYGLNNPKDATGAELDRLKLSIDYLAKVGGKDKLPSDEYDKLSATARKDILTRFGQRMTWPTWRGMNDEQKTKALESISNQITNQALAKARMSKNFKKLKP